MRAFITGGTGFIGRTLTGHLAAAGWEVTLLTRTLRPPKNLPDGVRYLEGDPNLPGPWQEAVRGHNLIINLAGANIFTRWTSEQRRLIYDSRIKTTRNLVDALAAGPLPDTVLISTSATGYYGYHGNETVTEEAPPGNDFLARLAVDWETRALQAEKFGVRTVICRFGVVLGRRGGALAKLLPVFRAGFGAPLGSGRQWFPWIHEADLAGILLFLTRQPEVRGVVNCVGPEPVTNREFTVMLNRLLERPTIFPGVPGFLLRLALGEVAGVVLHGQRISARRLLDLGYHFRYATVEEALRALLTHD
ncbi:MAG: TIGR01777 family oxidoreductase [Deltaproteobacteria bacterium]|nr:TIGR01777 family oxidoreductase [Candidatus Anaeroferrophillacea bacterium]